MDFPASHVRFWGVHPKFNEWNLKIVVSKWISISYVLIFRWTMLKIQGLSSWKMDGWKTYFPFGSWSLFRVLSYEKLEVRRFCWWSPRFVWDNTQRWQGVSFWWKDVLFFGSYIMLRIHVHSFIIDKPWCNLKDIQTSLALWSPIKISVNFPI